MRTVTADIMSEIDRRAREEYGIPSSVLMENAGRRVAELISFDNACEKEKTVIVLCGKGNNGGDGFVAGRYLGAAGFNNVGFFTSPALDISPGAAKENFDKINHLKMKIFPLSDFSKISLNEKNTLIIDALFGTGFKGELNKEYMRIGEKVNASGAPVYSVDVPSGLNATTGRASEGCVNAYKTVTFGFPKKGFYSGDGPEVCGKIIVADIGFPEELMQEYV